jgi:hypothetical protein
MMQVQPQKEHEWLQQMLGDWTFETECIMGPDQPPAKFGGTESVRTLGGLWVLCEGQGDTPDGGTAKNLITLGYDPQKQRFIGTFVASMMSHMWLYEGTLDESGKVLTLDTTGPSFTDPTKLTQYQDIFEIKSPDHRILSSRALGDDGKWHGFMTAHYHRKKA